ncbi:TPA: hypothetical protein DCE37_13570 [Candidatus Latescibacteria bacterium]|nr:hypothetical protein [Candidatus Latescibacterota bacterium]
MVGIKAMVPPTVRRAIKYPVMLAKSRVARDKPLHRKELIDVLDSEILNPCRHFRERSTPRFFVESSERDAKIEALREAIGDASVISIVKDADRICDRVFDLLGSGSTALGRPIDWHRDFKSGVRYDPALPSALFSLKSFPPGSDVKVPWELSRFQHVPTLGQAWWFTQDDKYAREFFDQFLDWKASNPPGLGINWACTMDVAIRLVNLIWGYGYFRCSAFLGDRTLEAFLCSVWEHSTHIENNLEFGYIAGQEVVSNHYLADVAGLVFAGILFPEFKDAGRWRQIGLEGLLRSMDEQVHDEGTDFESSVSYHRLTTEIFAACYALCDLNGVDIPDAFSERLAKMVEFVAAYARPDGLSPQIGDADDGRLQILSRYAGWNRQDHRYLQTIGSVLLDRPDLAAYPEGLADCVWLFGTERTDRNRSLTRERPTRSSVGFPAFGFYSLRSGEDELVISASRVGTRGIGNHKHNDVFGIELSLDGEPILVDPGACIYTADSALRNAFRSVTSHNTVTIDDYEQNGIPENNLFGLIESCVPKIHEWVVEGTGEHVFRGSHNGFHGLSEGCHERRVAMSPSADSLFTVADQVSASGEHRARWFFHFHPLATVELAPGLARVTQGRAIAMIGWKAETPIDADLGDGWTSSAYGRREPAPVLTLGTQFKDAVQLDLEIRKL